MAHIQLPEGLPGIRGPMGFSPETARPLWDLVHDYRRVFLEILGPMAFSSDTAKPLHALAEVLSRGPNSLSATDRGMIVTYLLTVSVEMESSSHDMKLNFESAAISDKPDWLAVSVPKLPSGLGLLNNRGSEEGSRHGYRISPRSLASGKSRNRAIVPVLSAILP